MPGTPSTWTEPGTTTNSPKRGGSSSMGWRPSTRSSAVEQLVTWIAQDDRELDTVTDVYFFADRPDSITIRNSAAYKGIYALLIKQGAVDWHHTDSPLSPGRLDEYSVNVREIFPKAW